MHYTNDCQNIHVFQVLCSFSELLRAESSLLKWSTSNHTFSFEKCQNQQSQLLDKLLDNFHHRRLNFLKQQSKEKTEIKSVEQYLIVVAIFFRENAGSTYVVTELWTFP